MVLAYFSRSRNIQICAIITGTEWALSNILVTAMGVAAVNVITPISILYSGLFWWLWHSFDKEKPLYFKIMFYLYAGYTAVGLWHLVSRTFAPDALSATYYFVLLFSNVIFVAIILVLCAGSTVKMISIRSRDDAAGAITRWFLRWNSRDKLMANTLKSLAALPSTLRDHAFLNLSADAQQPKTRTAPTPTSSTVTIDNVKIQRKPLVETARDLAKEIDDNE